MYFLHKIGIFHCHLSLPEGIGFVRHPSTWWRATQHEKICMTKCFGSHGAQTSHLDKFWRSMDMQTANLNVTG